MFAATSDVPSVLEQHQLCFLRERSRDTGTLVFSTAQRFYETVRDVYDLNSLHRFLDRCKVSLCGRCEPFLMCVATHHYEFSNLKTIGFNLALSNNTHALCALSGVELREGLLRLIGAADTARL